MGNDKLLKYEMTNDLVNYLLKALNKVQIVGVNQANDLITVTKLLQSPLNAEDLEKDQYESLKSKFDKPKEEKKK